MQRCRISHSVGRSPNFSGFCNVSRSPARDPLSPDYFEKAVHPPPPKKKRTAQVCVPHTVCAVVSEQLKTVHARSMKDWSFVHVRACRSTVCGVRSCDIHANLQLTSASQTVYVIIYWKCKLHCQRNVDKRLKIQGIISVHVKCVLRKRKNRA